MFYFLVTHKILFVFNTFCQILFFNELCRACQPLSVSTYFYSYIKYKECNLRFLPNTRYVTHKNLSSTNKNLLGSSRNHNKISKTRFISKEWMLRKGTKDNKTIELSQKLGIYVLFPCNPHSFVHFQYFFAKF